MPYTFKQIAGMSVDQISDLASRGDTYREFCAAVKKAAKAAAASDAPAPEQTEISVKPMTLTPDAEGTHRTDFFVSIRVGGREVTPHMFRERFKAEYHVALYDWLLNGGVEPDVMEFDENDWPARALSPSTQHVEADVLGGIRICPERDGPCPHGMECPFNGDRYRCDMVGSRAARGTTPSVDESGKGSE